MTHTKSIDELNQAARSIWQAGVAAVHAGEQVRQFVKVDQQALHFGDFAIPHANYRNLLVLGAGKSAGDMAAALEQALIPLAGRKTISGRVNVPDGREPDERERLLPNIQVVGCRPIGSNLPTERVLESTAQMMEQLRQCYPDDLVIALFTGGGSALLEQLVDSVSLLDLRAVTTLLSQTGASIEELNLVRSQLSRVKAGGLARIAPCRQMVSLLISDVLGDSIAAIASGPTWLADSSSLLTQRSLAKEILLQHDLGFAASPASVVRRLQSPPEVLEASNPLPEVKHFIVANNQRAVQAAWEQAVSLGFEGIRETDFSPSTVESVAQRLLDQLRFGSRDSQPVADRGCFISGGEPTLDLGRSPGRGGRNQHLVLTLLDAVLKEWQAQSPDLANICFSFLSAGTDGEDGNVAVAGAQIDSEKIRRLKDSDARDEVRQSLDRADSFTLLEKLNCIFRASDTHTNVCDLRVLLWERSPAKSVP